MKLLEEDKLQKDLLYLLQNINKTKENLSNIYRILQKWITVDNKVREK